MKKIFLAFFVISVSNFSNAQTNQDIQSKVEENIKIVENFFSLKPGETLGPNVLQNACHYLSNVTGIKCPMFNDWEPTYAPNEKVLAKWKKWFAKNKNKVFWDEDSETYKIK
jgi:hypothetical protein